MDDGQETINEIVKAWTNAKNIVVFTGAGMSTESGLPDFRSAQGLWKVRPESLATIKALLQQPDEFYFFYQLRIKNLSDVMPNQGHHALTSLQQKRNLSVITQNVDGLHQQAIRKRLLNYMVHYGPFAV